MSPKDILRSARRLFSRTEMPMRITIDGQTMPVLNWSLGGIALSRSSPIDPRPGQPLAGSLELLVGGVSLAVKVTLRLAHRQADRFGFSFVDLTPEQMGMLRALLVRGGANPLERAPLPAAAPSPLAATAAAPRPVPARRRRRRIDVGRWAMRSAAALVLIAAFAGIAAVALVKKSAVESAQAAVAVPTRVASIADRGYVDQILVRPGQAVRPGDPLLSIRRRAEPAKAVGIASPCACTVVAVLVEPGNAVVNDQPLVQLADPAPETFIEALVPADTELAVGRRVPVVVEGRPEAGSGRIVAIDAERTPVGRYGLPPVLRQDPRYRLVLVGELSGLGPLTPGQSARLPLGEAKSWPERLQTEAGKVAARVTRLIDPLRAALRSAEPADKAG